LGSSDARGYMIRTIDWKYVYFKGFPPQLFDLKSDPDEFFDLGKSAEHEPVRQLMFERLTERLLSRKNRVTMTDEEVAATRAGEKSSGIVIGKW